MRTLWLPFVCLVLPTAAFAQQPQGWDLALTGGFVVSGLTDPIYALGAIPGRIGRFVIRENDQESTASLGVAMFGQVYHDRAPWIAPLSIGLGIRGDNRATFFLGSALRLGPHASLTGCAAVGPVATLPPGVHELQAVSDPNQLLDLPSRVTHSWFAGVTDTFFDDPLTSAFRLRVKVRRTAVALAEAVRRTLMAPPAGVAR